MPLITIEFIIQKVVGNYFKEKFEMSGYWDWGLRVVVWLQTNAGGWKPLLQALSLLGTEEFLLPLGIALY
jgi:hypothetical protein